jgi:hypothetical protein
MKMHKFARQILIKYSNQFDKDNIINQISEAVLKSLQATISDYFSKFGKESHKCVELFMGCIELDLVSKNFIHQWAEGYFEEMFHRLRSQRGEKAARITAVKLSNEGIQLMQMATNDLFKSVNDAAEECQNVFGFGKSMIEDGFSFSADPDLKFGFSVVMSHKIHAGLKSEGIPSRISQMSRSK